jgi:hypothetical protein
MEAGQTRSARWKRCQGCGAWIIPGTQFFEGGYGVGYVECQNCREWFERELLQQPFDFELAYPRA